MPERPPWSQLSRTAGLTWGPLVTAPISVSFEHQRSTMSTSICGVWLHISEHMLHHSFPALIFNTLSHSIPIIEKSMAAYHPLLRCTAFSPPSMCLDIVLSGQAQIQTQNQQWSLPTGLKLLSPSIKETSNCVITRDKASLIWHELNMSERKKERA